LKEILGIIDSIQDWIKSKKTEDIEESLKGLINAEKTSGFGEMNDILIFCFQNAESIIELLYIHMLDAPFSLRVLCKMCFEQLSNRVHKKSPLVTL
jgi:hypothetical protein